MLQKGPAILFNLLTVEVRTIRWKFPGCVGSSLAVLLGISLMTATFHNDGILPYMMTLLNKFRRVGWGGGGGGGMGIA